MYANTVIRKIVTKISIGGTSLLGRSLPSNMEAINITSHLAAYCIRANKTAELESTYLRCFGVWL